MKFKEVATSNASTEAKVAALALLLDKELIKLADTVLNVKKLEGPKGEQGIQGPKGEQGDRGFDGTNGKDGADGKDGKDGEDGKQGVGVADAKIDFDGSLVITLTDGTEINAGDVVPLDTAEKIRVIGNGGGTSQSILDAIDAINAIISTYGTMALQDDTAVDINGGAIDGTAIGAAVPATGVFTTLTATTGAFKNGNTDTANTAFQQVFEYGGSGNGYKHFITSNHNNANSIGNSIKFWLNYSSSASGSSAVGTNNINTFTNDLYSTSIKTYGGTQFNVAHTASAVNYVQVTGSSTSNWTSISAQGSDTNITQAYVTKGSGQHVFGTNGASSNTQLRISHVSSAINYATISGGQSSGSPIFGVAGTDTNISQVFQSKGTGAIDLAAGSRGVNISNGGTVTAITRTAGGVYTSVPSTTITAPTTAGGVQATAQARVYVYSNPITTAGSGYTVGDVLTAVGGTGTAYAHTVASVNGSGGVTAIGTITQYGDYTVAPTNPVTFSGGTGSGFTSNMTWTVLGTLNITNAGSGYVEQPTVSFSGGGGSGAAAYATVGSYATIKAIGSGTNKVTNQAITFETPNSITSGNPAFLIRDAASFDSWYQMGPSSSQAFLVAKGNANASAYLGASGTGSVRFTTNGDSITEQMRVSHTASAVNYVQVTGGATGNATTISTQGSDSSITSNYSSKGPFSQHIFLVNGYTSFQVSASNGVVANRLSAQATLAGNAPILSAQGSDTNIDLALTTKGTGAVNAITGGGTQFKVSNTASAVNYVQVTGGATGSSTRISAQGSDSLISLGISSKGAGDIFFQNSGSSSTGFLVKQGTGTVVNYLQVASSATTAAPVLSAQGSDTNIDLTLTPKGTGLVRFGTYTAGAPAATGYISIKAADGTTYKVLVGT